MPDALLPPGQAYYEAWHKADEKMRPPGMAVPAWDSLPVGVQNEWIIMDEVARALYATRAAVPPDAVRLSKEEREGLELIHTMVSGMHKEERAEHIPIEQWEHETLVDIGLTTLRALLARAEVGTMPDALVALDKVIAEMDADILGPRPRQIPKRWPDELKAIRAAIAG